MGCGDPVRARPAGARGGYGRQSGGRSASADPWGLGAPPANFCDLSWALVVREVLDHRESGERDHDAANEHVRDLLPLGSLLCSTKRLTWGRDGGWECGRVRSGQGHARIASSIECPDICRTPVGARMESRRRAIMMRSSRRWWARTTKTASLSGLSPPG